MRFAITVHAEQRRKCGELKPPDQAFSKGRIAVHTAIESTNICRPPGNSSEPHVKASSELDAQRFEARIDIARPMRAPYRWLPAHAHRTRLMMFSCFAAAIPSKKP